MSTITTVGYGDHYPVTFLGRCVAAGLMVGGIAVLGVVTASVASWMVQSVARETKEELDAAEAPVHEELRRLSAQIAQLTEILRAHDPSNETQERIAAGTRKAGTLKDED